MKLLLATRNAHKTAEFAAILGAEFDVVDLRTMPALPVVEETGSTFEENATLKAVAASRCTDMLVVADDSGLEVAALDGAPGIRSARYAGDGATDTQNLEKLLAELRAIGAESNAAARFRCALAVAHRGEVAGIYGGEVAGHIIEQPIGTTGFGYDPVFVPTGFETTFAALPVAVKNAVSHRARAIAALRTYLTERQNAR